MGQVLGPEWLSQLVIASATSITLAPTYQGKQVRVTVGGQQYAPASTLTLNLASTGAGGLDTGALAANTLYYIYAVRSANQLALVASTRDPTLGPLGFLSWKEIGRFRTAVGSAATASGAIVNKIGPGDMKNGGISNSPQIVTFTPNHTNTSVTALETRELEFAYYRLSITFTGAITPLNQSLELTLPPSRTISTFNIVSIFTSSNNVLRESSGGFFDLSGTIGFPAQVKYHNATTIRPQWWDDAASGIVVQNDFGSGAPVAIANGDTMILNFKVPIAEWMGLFD